jgi:hypothetical protein
MQSAKIYLPSVKEDFTSMFFRFEHEENALSPAFFNPEGRQIFAIFLLWVKARSPISLRPLGKTISLGPEQ